jgi:hypothetical protein
MNFLLLNRFLVIESSVITDHFEVFLSTPTWRMEIITVRTLRFEIAPPNKKVSDFRPSVVQILK